MNAVCLLSGGLDSATCLGVARRAGFDCYALSFDYGQRHRVELEAAARVAHHRAPVAGSRARARDRVVGPVLRGDREVRAAGAGADFFDRHRWLRELREFRQQRGAGRRDPLAGAGARL